MTDHRGHLQLQVEGLDGVVFHRAEDEMEAPSGRDPEVRALELASR